MGRRPPRGGRGLKSFYFYSIPLYYGSPPSRGAWIEIFLTLDMVIHPQCRPPRGGRGLKLFEELAEDLHFTESPPSRGAWIEMILILTILFTSNRVAPLAGGVD